MRITSLIFTFILVLNPVSSGLSAREPSIVVTPDSLYFGQVGSVETKNLIIIINNGGDANIAATDGAAAGIYMIRGLSGKVVITSRMFSSIVTCKRSGL